MSLKMEHFLIALCYVKVLKDLSGRKTDSHLPSLSERDLMWEKMGLKPGRTKPSVVTGDYRED